MEEFSSHRASFAILLVALFARRHHVLEGCFKLAEMENVEYLG